MDQHQLSSSFLTLAQVSRPAIIPVPAAAVTNLAANIRPWQWAVVAAATAMEGSRGKANSNGGETRACVAGWCDEHMM
jgi:hypothetical protein